MNVSAIFSLAAIIVASGKSPGAIGSLIALEPSLLPVFEGHATFAQELDAFAALPAATEEQEIKAAQNLLGVLGALIEDPAYKARTVAALKGLLS